MGINKKNAEGYMDLTVYNALKDITNEEKAERKSTSATYRKKVYICSPYRGHSEQDVGGNVARAIEYCRYAIKQGVFPICPHIYLTRFLNDSDDDERRLGLELGLELLRECSEVWVFAGNPGGRNQISEGMRGEIAEANRRNIRIKYKDCERERPVQEVQSDA
jgi:hypothetical protein